MSYCCLFNTNAELTEKNDVIRRDCFRGSYGMIQSFNKINIFVLKTYNYPYLDDNKLTLNNEEVFQYYNYLLEMGFKLNLIEGNCTLHGKKLPCYIFTIPIQENSNISNLIIINYIRYLYEKNGRDKLERFLELMKIESDVPAFNRYLMVHNSSNVILNGHTLNISLTNLVGNFTLKEWTENILNDKKKVSVTSSAFSNFSAVSQKDIIDLDQLFINNKKEYLIKYTELYDKYKKVKNIPRSKLEGIL